MGPGFRRDDGYICGEAFEQQQRSAKHLRHHRTCRRGQDGWRDADRLAGAGPRCKTRRGIRACTVSGNRSASRGGAARPPPHTPPAGAITAVGSGEKPQSFREAGATLKSHVAPATLVVSIMAGTTIKSLQETVGGAVVRAMPNTPAAIGRGITVAVAGKGVS